VCSEQLNIQRLHISNKIAMIYITLEQLSSENYKKPDFRLYTQKKECTDDHTKLEEHKE